MVPRLRMFALWVAALCFAAAACAGTDGQVTLAADLRKDAETARKQGVPILLFYSLKGCPYCEVIRTSHLLPMQREATADRTRVIIRQINLQDGTPLRDFAGRTTTHREYSQAQKISFAPVVTLVDGDGKALADPLKGAMLPDFYGAHLDDAIALATDALKERRK